MFEKVKKWFKEGVLTHSEAYEAFKEIEEAEKKIAELEANSVCMFCERPSIEKRLQVKIELLQAENSNLKLLLKQAYESDGNKHKIAVELQKENEQLKKDLGDARSRAWSLAGQISDMPTIPNVRNELRKKIIETLNKEPIDGKQLTLLANCLYQIEGTKE